MSFFIILSFISIVWANPDNDDKDKDQPFVETGAFIAIIVTASVLLFCLVCCLTCSVSNGKWVKNAKMELEARTEIAETPKGKIEYKKWGEAPYMLFIHGTPGSAHMDFGAHKLGGFGVITVSRPGYAITPLTDTTKSAEGQADLLAALMTHLGIEKFPVMAASGGGCVAYRIGIQHPDKVACLILQCATSGGFRHPQTEEMGSLAKMMDNSPLFGRMLDHAMQGTSPEPVIQDIMGVNRVKPGCVSQKDAEKRANEIMKDPMVQAVLPQLRDFAKFGPCYPDGFNAMKNDLVYYQQFIPFDQVKVPVHMIHADTDPEIPYSQSVQAHQGIPGSILINQQNGSHSCFYHDKFKENCAQQMEFAKKHMGLPFDQEILDKEL